MKCYFQGCVEDPTHECLFDRKTVYICKTIGEWLAERGKLPTIVPVDEDIAEWFKAQGQDYQAPINTVLRDYIEARRDATS